MTDHDAREPGLNLLLLIRDEAWRDAARQNAGPAASVSIVTTAKEMLEQIRRVHHPFTHVLVEPSAAAGCMTEIGRVMAHYTGRTALVLLGPDTPESTEIEAGRAASPLDLAYLIHGDPHAEPVDVMTPADILHALSAGLVECQFQPIVRLSDGAPVGVEALARLQHPHRGTLTPDMFLPQIETAGLSMRFTEVVVQAALNGVDRDFLARNSMFITINLPLDVLLLPDALDLVESSRNAVGIDLRNIVIELTESRPVFDIPVLNEALLRWREVGYHLAIDDLGPEMVNQTDLFDLPFDVVKLDKTVVLRSRENALAQRYLKRTIANAQARSLRIIAEGIEDGALWSRMRDLGVDYAQGFLIARAMRASQLEAWRVNWLSRLQQPV